MRSGITVFHRVRYIIYLNKYILKISVDRDAILEEPQPYMGNCIEGVLVCFPCSMFRYHSLALGNNVVKTE